MRTGDLIFVRNEFSIKNPGTWMGTSIRSILNIDNVLEHKPKMYYNHVAFVVDKGTMFKPDFHVMEAGWNMVLKRGEVIITPFEQWKSARKEGTYLIKEAKFNFNGSTFAKLAFAELGKGYDFASVLLAQPIRQLTGKRVWLGSRISTKKWYCSELYAYLMFKATNGLGFSNYYEIDPEDLFSSVLFG